MRFIFEVGKFFYGLRFLACEFETGTFVIAGVTVCWGRSQWGWKVWTIDRDDDFEIRFALYAGKIRKGWALRGPLRRIPV